MDVQTPRAELDKIALGTNSESLDARKPAGLDYPPLIKPYCPITSAMRTEREKAHILSLKDVAFARRFFDIGEVCYWHIIGDVRRKVPDPSARARCTRSCLGEETGHSTAYLDFHVWADSTA